MARGVLIFGITEPARIGGGGIPTERPEFLAYVKTMSQYFVLQNAVQKKVALGKIQGPAFLETEP